MFELRTLASAAQQGTADPVSQAQTGAQRVVDLARDRGTEVALKLLGAFAIWIVGRWVVGAVGRLLRRALEARQVDPTIQRYVGAVVETLLNIGLVLAILGFFGFETTTFAALLGAAGVAVGMAWSGLLAHFAAGAMLVVLRPFKVGDFVEAGGVTGTVAEVGMFVTKIVMPDNVEALVGNNKIFSDTIKNFSTNAFRRVDLKAQLAHGADVAAAVSLLRESVARIPNVIKEPAVDVEVEGFTLAGPVLCVRPYTHTDHYWQVYFETNATIRNELGKAGFPVPEQHVQLAQPTSGK